MPNRPQSSNSFEQRFYLENPSLAARLLRNAALLILLIRAAWAWVFKGYRLRRALKQAERTDSKILLEDWAD